jgi:hypothetical protein
MRRIPLAICVALVSLPTFGSFHAHQDTTFETTLVGVVVPDEIQPGDQVMGTVTLNPEKYEGTPGLRVITAEIPTKGSGTSGELSGTIIEVGTPSADPQKSGELTGVIVEVPKKKEDHKGSGTLGKILMTAGQAGANQLPLLFRPKGGGQPIASRNIPVTPATGPPPQTFEVPSVIGGNDIPEITGPIGTPNPRIEIGETPAEVIAGGPRTTYFEVPENMTPGGNQTITMREQPVTSIPNQTPGTPAAPQTGTPAVPSDPSKPAMPADPAKPAMPADPTKPANSLAPGQSVVFDNIAIVGIGLRADGPTKVMNRGTETPIEASVTGNLPPALLDRPLPSSRYLAKIPFRALKGAPRVGDRGKIGIHIENRSPQTIRLEGEEGGAITKWFSREEAASGRMVVKSKIIARRAGGYNVRARVIPMVAPALGKVSAAAGTPAR